MDTKKLKSPAASNQNEWTSSKDKVALILASKQTNFLSYPFFIQKKNVIWGINYSNHSYCKSRTKTQARLFGKLLE